MKRYLINFSNHIFAIANHWLHSSRNDRGDLGFNYIFNYDVYYNYESQKLRVRCEKDYSIEFTNKYNSNFIGSIVFDRGALKKIEPGSIWSV